MDMEGGRVMLRDAIAIAIATATAITISRKHSDSSASSLQLKFRRVFFLGVTKVRRSFHFIATALFILSPPLEIMYLSLKFKKL